MLLLVFGRFTNDPKCVLATVYMLALVGIKLTLNCILSLPQFVRVCGELRVAMFTDAEQWNASRFLYDPKFSLWHKDSLAPNACANETAPVPALRQIPNRQNFTIVLHSA